MTAVTRPALRYHGGKFRLAPWVLQFFPPHIRYVEPFGGAAGVLLRKPRSYAEIYNDIDGDIVNFFRVLRDPALRARFTELCELTPYAREEFAASYAESDDPVERARRTAIRAAMGFGSGGATKNSTGFRIDSARESSLSSHNWSRYPSHVASIGERFAGVIIENRPAIEVMQQHDGEEVLHYVDPPYVHDTRSGRVNYRHEMDDAAHHELLDALRGLTGYVVLSGYDHEIYQQLERDGWKRTDTEARISAGRGTAVRTESVWLNPACCAALERRHGGLFA